MCKHKLALLKGDKEMLLNPSEEPLLQQVLSSEVYALLKPRLEEYEKQISDLEREMSILRTKEKHLKTSFSYELQNGRPKPGAV